jgi:hypothetical protein
MIAGLRLMPLFLRRGNKRDDLTALGLTAVGVAVAVALTLVVLSLRPGLDARDDRMAWREPTPAPQDQATAVQVRSTELFDGQMIDRVELAPTETDGRDGRSDDAGRVDVAPTRTPTPTSTAAATDAAADQAEAGGGGLPVPPGLPRFPGDGEVFVSPALARLLEDEPAGRLAERFPGVMAGTIGADGLAQADELVAVVGHGPGALEPDPAADRQALDQRLPDEPSAVTPVATFATSGNHPKLESYKATASMGAVLLVVPALLLVGSAARLTAARRNQRLAALRLAGATPGAVLALTAAETAAAALAGSVLGVVLYTAALPLVAHAPAAGGVWAVADLWLGAPALLLTIVVTPLLAAACAAVALRRVVISPLGVAQRVGSRRPRTVRLLGMAAAWAVLGLAARTIGGGDELTPVLVGLGLVIGSLALVGPWITWVLGAVTTRLARRPSTLLAGRRIVDDPKGAYRAISGIVLAGLTAGFLFTIGPVIEQLDGRGSGDRALEAWVETSDGAALRQTVTDRLDGAGLDATVTIDGDAASGDPFASGPPEEGVELSVVPGRGTDREQVRTVLEDVLPRRPLVAADDDIFGDRLIVHDFRRASLALAIATMVLAATTTAIASSASILDQRATLRRMRLAGTPVATLQRARAWQAALPLVVATLGSLATGVGTALLLLGAAGNDKADSIGLGDLAPMLGVVGVGLALALAASAVTRPLLVAATADPST